MSRRLIPVAEAKPPQEPTKWATKGVVRGRSPLTNCGRRPPRPEGPRVEPKARREGRRPDRRWGRRPQKVAGGLGGAAPQWGSRGRSPLVGVQGAKPPGPAEGITARRSLAESPKETRVEGRRPETGGRRPTLNGPKAQKVEES